MKTKYEYLEGPMNLPGSQESTGRILKHRWLARKILGRDLRHNETVLKRDPDKDYTVDNIIVFASRFCSNRWYSENREKYLIEREPNVFDYDWAKINEEKAMKVKQSNNHRKNTQQVVQEIRIYLEAHPNSSVDEIASALGEDIQRVRNFCNYHKLPYKKGEKAPIPVIITMPRKELLEKITQFDLNKFGELCNTSPSYASTLLKRRGIHYRYRKLTIVPFKHMTLSKMKKVCEEFRSKKAAIEKLGICEENFDVEARRLSIYKYKFVFNTNEEDCDYEPEVDISDNIEIKLKGVSLPFEEPETVEEPEEPETVEEPEASVEEPVVETSQEDDMQDNILPKEETISHINDFVSEVKTTEDTVYYVMDKYDISLRDVTFLTGRSPEDLVQNGNVSINDTDVENLNNVREILTKNNIFALLKNHDVSEIARFYHYNVSTVMYVVSSI